MSDRLDTTFDTPEPIELHVENGRGLIDVTAADTTETTVHISGDRADAFEVRDLADGKEPRRIAIIAPRRDGGFFGKDHKADIVVVMPAGERPGREVRQRRRVHPRTARGDPRGQRFGRPLPRARRRPGPAADRLGRRRSSSTSTATPR